MNRALIVYSRVHWYVGNKLPGPLLRTYLGIVLSVVAAGPLIALRRVETTLSTRDWQPNKTLDNVTLKRPKKAS